MKALVVVDDPVLKDQIQVGLEEFGDIEAEFETGIMVLDRVRRTDYGFLFLVLDQYSRAESEFLDKLEEADPDLDILLMASDVAIRHVKEERSRSQILGFLHRPLRAVEFFRGVSRARSHADAVAPRS